MEDIETLQAELRKAKDEENAAYWHFTRSARGKPVSAEITRRIVALEAKIGNLKWANESGHTW